jgi:hypothetical protein
MSNFKNRGLPRKKIGFRRYIKDDDNIKKAEIKEPPEIQPIKTNKNGSQNIKKNKGRPRTKVNRDKNTRSRNISICLSLSEEIAWKKIARLNGKSLSAFVRDLVNGECL